MGGSGFRLSVYATRSPTMVDKWDFDHDWLLAVNS